MMSPITSVRSGASRGALCIIRSQQQRSSILARALSSNATTNPPSSTHSSPTTPQIITDEGTLLSQLSPLKRIICLCPVPLGRGRVSWSGGDSFYPPPHDQQTMHLNHYSQQPNNHNNITSTSMQPPTKVAKYRYGERFAIGVAVSDAYLTHARPIHLGSEADEMDGLKRRFTAEIVPTFRCDAHNLGQSPVFHTNLPYFRNDFLQHIGHFDVGAIVLALPMKPSRNPFCPTPTKVQLEQEQKIDQVRECLLGVLQNYVSHEDDESDDETVNGERNSANNSNGNQKRHPRFLGPLNIQGIIDHRLSINEVLSKSNDDGSHLNAGNWDHISKSLRQIQNEHTMGRGGMGDSNFLGNQEYGAYNVFSSVPPEIHAAVALNAMMEKYTIGCHTGMF